MVARMSSIIITNILDSLVDLVGEEAVTTVIRVATQKTAEQLIRMYGISGKDVGDIAHKVQDVIKRELDTDISIKIQENGNKIIINVNNCKFAFHEGQAISRVLDILRSRKLCILALLCLSLIEKSIGKRYDVGSVTCSNGNATIEILSPELYLKS